MADNVAITAGTGTSIAADEVVDGTLGTVKVQYFKLMDGTLDGTSKAVVKAASTAAVAADGALVVAVSPNNPVNIQGASQASSTAGLTASIASATGTANTTAICVAAVGSSGNATITFKGTFSATLAFEASDDSGTTWYPVQAARSDFLLAATSTGAITTAQMWNVSCPGITHLRARCSTFVSGTCTVVIFPGGFLYAPSVAVLHAALTKGTQGANGVTTQDLKDSGRTGFACATVIAGVTAVTTEALLTMVPVRAGVASATTTSQSVTSGKTLRLVSVSVGFVSSAAAVLSMRFALRMNPTGAVVASSPILEIFALPSGAALAQAGGGVTVPLPDGIEFSGTQQWGITQVGSAATGTVWVSAKGFEY